MYYVFAKRKDKKKIQINRNKKKFKLHFISRYRV